MAYPVARYAKRYGIPIALATALIGQESGGAAAAVSPKGATGLTQVMPSTAAGMYGITESQAAKRLRNPQFALDAGFRYLAAQKKAFGSWRLALAAYNAGPNAVREYGGVPPYDETQNYVRSILGKAGSLKTAGAAGSAAVGTSLDAASSPSPQGFDPTSLALENLSQIGSGRFDPVGALASLASSAHANGPQSPPTGLGGSGAGNVSIETPRRLTKAVRGAVSLVQEYLGTPYVWGGESPKGFDCSGLLQYVWGKQGVSIPRTTYDQIKVGKPVGKGGLRAGDAVFFGTPDNPHHVGMMISRTQFVEAPHTGAVVRISNLRGRSDYLGARRFR